MTARWSDPHRLPVPPTAIADAHKLTLKALLAFPENSGYRAKPGLIHPGDVVRVK